MDMKKTITIDLEKYGMDGQIVLRAPTFRKIIELRNEVSKMASVKISSDGTPEGSLSDIAEGDLDIVQKMAFVREAPFKTTVQGFLAFQDKMDEICLGNASMLWEDISRGIAEIDGEDADSSPFVNSPEAERGNSE